MASAAALPLDVSAPPVAALQPSPFGSALYEVAPPAVPSEVKLDLIVHATEGQPDPFIALLPASGTWSDLMSFGTSVTFLAVDEPFLLLVVDRGTPGSYTYDFAATATGVLAFEAEPNDNCANNDPVATFPTTVTASLEGPDAIDWFTIAVTEENQGMRLRSRTTAGETDTDVELTVVEGCGDTIAGPVDIDLHENLLSPPLAEGYYAVRARPSQTFPFNGSSYKITFSLEP